MSNAAYITGLGSFFPGPPVANHEIAGRLGVTGRRALQIGRKALRQNGIQTRHYALGDDGRPQFTNAEMAALAGRAALEQAGMAPDDVDMIAAASSAGDLMAPGLASGVHGELGGHPAEVASFTSFCASGMMALKAAVNNTLAATIAGPAKRGLVCASEFASRFLRDGYLEGAERDLSAEFLRWMLSDGAGAAVVEPAPRPQGLSLRVDWIDIKSYADRMPYCMTGGGIREESGAWLPWSNAPTLSKAVAEGAFHLRQDLKLLEQIVPLGLQRYLQLIEAGQIDPNTIDWALYHFSSDIFRRRMIDEAGASGIPIHANRLFTNLYDRGNVGSASIFVMLDELMASGRAKPGQRILCMVPESGRFIFAFMMLTVVGDGQAAVEAVRKEPVKTQRPDSEPAKTRSHDRAIEGLTQVWAEFETELASVPLVRRLNHRRATLEDYKGLILNLRQQVIDGARWIARAASNITSQDADLRTTFLAHATDEHRDYTLLEKDYVACGGSLETIRGASKNVGSEALSAWMFQRASREDPFDLLGAMFVIEGLGNRMAARWADQFRVLLSLGPDQIRFLTHHAAADADHMARFHQVLRQVVTDDRTAEAVIKTAKVTARLYRLQLEEIGNC